jgi:hypothetical protein
MALVLKKKQRVLVLRITDGAYFKKKHIFTCQV